MLESIYTIVSGRCRLGCFRLSMVLAFVVAFFNSQLSVANPEIAGKYRGIPYKAPTPISVEGGKTLLFASEVKELIDTSDVVLVNVSPITLSPPAKDGRRVWIPKRGKPMKNIPGSIWLPNVGYQSLDSDMFGYLSSNLEKHTEGNPERPLLFYCTADCWMSWNTVKRVSSELGYRQVYWYPSGIDGWAEQGYQLEPASPVPFSEH